MSELYEELPGDNAPEEDLYEDLPALPSELPSPAHQPPPPVTSMPPQRATNAAMHPPAIPQRAPGTVVTASKSPKKDKKPAPAPAPKRDSGGEGSNINMKEIVQLAKKRSGSTMESIKDLEEKKHRKSEEVAPPPWAGQLQRKRTASTAGEDNASTSSLEEKSELEKHLSMLSHRLSQNVTSEEDSQSGVKVTTHPDQRPERAKERPLPSPRKPLPLKELPPKTSSSSEQLAEPSQPTDKASDLPSEGEHNVVGRPKPLPKPKPLPTHKTRVDPLLEAAEPATDGVRPSPKVVHTAAKETSQSNPTTEPEQKDGIETQVMEAEPSAEIPPPPTATPLRRSNALTDESKAKKPQLPLKPKTSVELKEDPNTQHSPKIPPKPSSSHNDPAAPPSPSVKPLPEKLPQPLPKVTSPSTPQPLQVPLPPSFGAKPLPQLPEKNSSSELALKVEKTNLPAPSGSPLSPTEIRTSAEPTPTMGSLQKFRRRPLEMVDSNQPPPMPSRKTKPGQSSTTALPLNAPPPAVLKKPSAVNGELNANSVPPTQGEKHSESEAVQEDLYEDTASPTQGEKHSESEAVQEDLYEDAVSPTQGEKHSESEAVQEDLYEDTVPPTQGEKHSESEAVQEDLYEDTVSPTQGEKHSESEAVQEDLYEDAVSPTPPPPPSASKDKQDEKPGEEEGPGEEGQPEELYDDVQQAAPPPPKSSAPPPPPPKSSDPPPPPQKSSGPPSMKPPLIPVTPEEEEEEMERETRPLPPKPIQQEDETYDGGFDEGGTIASSLSPSTSMTASLQLPPTLPELPDSPATSPSPDRKNKAMSKEERRQLKEEEKREKEEEKRRKEREKDEKKKKEAIVKNKQKCLKNLKQFALTMETQPLFAVELLLDHPTATKEHIAVDQGEVAMVLLMTHDKLPKGKYIVEKSDGTVGYVDTKLCQRKVLHQSSNSVLGTALPIPDDATEEAVSDIYESVGTDDVRRQLAQSSAPPPLPSLPPPTSRSQMFFPPPSCPAPPPPKEDEQEETYEALPDESSA